MDPVTNLKQGIFFLIEQPLEFERDLETGRVVLRGLSAFHTQGVTVETPVGLVLSREAAQKLLLDLPEFETLLREATSVPTKPSSVQ